MSLLANPLLLVAGPSRLALGSPATGGVVRLSRVCAVDRDEVRVHDDAPLLGHRPYAERGGQADHRRAVSNPGLLLEMNQSQTAHQLGGEVTLLRAECSASREGDAFGAIDGVPVAVGGDEGRVAG